MRQKMHCSTIQNSTKELKKKRVSGHYCFGDGELNIQENTVAESSFPKSKGKLSIFQKLLKLLNTPGKRRGYSDTRAAQRVAESDWQQQKASVQKRIEQYKTSGH